MKARVQSLVWPAWKRIRPIKWFWQRGRHGYSDRDLWSVDHYLFGVLSKALPDLARTTHGHPCMGHEPRCPFMGGDGWPGVDCACGTDWETQLVDMGALCARLAADDYDGERWFEDQEADFEEAMAWMTRWLQACWD